MKPLIYRIFIIIILVLVVILIAGSLYAFIRAPGAGPLFRIGGAREQELQRLDNEELGVFTGIGRLRIPVSGQPPLTIILSVSFPYPANDRPFVEELSARTGELRSIATEYFASLPREQMVNLDEALAKAEILKRYNTLLRLGKIEALYFGDLMMVE